MLYVWISIDVIAARRRHQISLGTGHSNEIEGVVSAHGNFAAYTPLSLVLLFLNEQARQSPMWLLTLIASLLVIGRFAHFMGLSNRLNHFRYRKIGMHLTLWPMLLLGFLCLYSVIISNV